MTKFYKYGFYAVIIIASILITFFNVRRIRVTNNLSLSDSKFGSFRLSGLASSFDITGKYFPNLKLVDVINEKEKIINLENPTIILMLSNFGCSQCQNRELSIYQKLFNENKINIIGVFNSHNRDMVLQLKRITNAQFDLYFGQEEVFEKYKISVNYPQILYVVKNVVISAFQPIPEDDEFSNWYAGLIKKKALFN